MNRKWKNILKGVTPPLIWHRLRQFQTTVDADARERAAILETLRNYPRYTPVEVTLLGREFSVADAASFLHSYQEIFQDEIYRFPSDKTTPLIIDCGSSYGTSILYFKTLYPDSRIIGFEADPHIFELLSRNIATYHLQSVTIHNRAVWFEERELDFHREYADAGRLTNDTALDTIRVQTVRLSDFLTEDVDLLKVDIEGAEVEVLTQIKKMDNIRHLFVEYHSFVGQPQRLDQLLAFLREQGYRFQIHTQSSSARPFVDKVDNLGMDMQLNIFASRSTTAGH